MSNNVVEKVEFDFSVFVVIDPAIGGIGVLPAIVIEIGEGRAPEPAQWIRLGFQGHILKRAVSLVAQKSVAGGHLLEYPDETQP